MGIEKISGAVSYQGSAAVASTQGVAQVTETVASSREGDAIAAPKSTQFEKIGNEGVEQHPEDLTATQSVQLKNAVNDLNKQLNNSEAIYGIHDKTNRVTIKIVDKTTKEVIKEFPPEQTLDMIAKVWELAGILVDEKR